MFEYVVEAQSLVELSTIVRLRGRASYNREQGRAGSQVGKVRPTTCADCALSR
jgi:hypothetical protein